MSDFIKTDSKAISKLLQSHNLGIVPDLYLESRRSEAGHKYLLQKDARGIIRQILSPGIITRQAAKIQQILSPVSRPGTLGQHLAKNYTCEKKSVILSICSIFPKHPPVLTTRCEGSRNSRSKRVGV